MGRRESKDLAKKNGKTLGKGVFSVILIYSIKYSDAPSAGI